MSFTAAIQLLEAIALFCVTCAVILLALTQLRHLRTHRDNRCQHQWVDRSAEFIQPASNPLQTIRGSSSQMDLALRFIEKQESGWTIVHQRCSICGEIRSVEMRGRYELHLVRP